MEASTYLSRCYARWQSAHLFFYTSFPALFWALFMLIGLAAHLVSPYFWILGPLLACHRKRLEALILLLVGWGYSCALYPHLPSTCPVEGEALIHIENIQNYSSPFYRTIGLDVMLRYFKTEDQLFHRLPCRLYLKKGTPCPDPSFDYHLPQAELSEIAPRTYLLRRCSAAPRVWQVASPAKLTLVGKRFRWKQNLAALLNRYYHDPDVTDLLTTLATGERMNRFLSVSFSQVGLSHLLAISGFHFALIALLTTTLLNKIWGDRIGRWISLLLLSLYFLYMGATPSIQRAWITLLLFLVSSQFQVQRSGLNFFGVTLLVALVHSPLILFNIGFQLSFAATFGLLTLYHPIEKGLRLLLPQHPFDQVRTSHPIEQVALLILTYLRKMGAVNLAALLFSWPILLFHFHQLSLSSFLYNLFVPLLVLLLLSALSLALLLPFLHPLVEQIGLFVVKIVTLTPKRFLLMLYCDRLSLGATVTILLATGWGVILLLGTKRLERAPLNLFVRPTSTGK